MASVMTVPLILLCVFAASDADRQRYNKVAVEVDHLFTEPSNVSVEAEPKPKRSQHLLHYRGMFSTTGEGQVKTFYGVYGESESAWVGKFNNVKSDEDQKAFGRIRYCTWILKGDDDRRLAIVTPTKTFWPDESSEPELIKWVTEHFTQTFPDSKATGPLKGHDFVEETLKERPTLRIDTHPRLSQGRSQEDSGASVTAA